MPLKTQTFGLREERDRLDSQLDGLAEQVADLEAGHDITLPAGLGSDDVPAGVMQECQELFEEYTQTQDSLAGVAWAVEAFGDPEVATDGGEQTDGLRTSEGEQGESSGSQNEDPDIEAVRQEMMADSDDGPSRPPVEGLNPPNTGDRDAPTTDSSGLTVTFGGLTAGELARMTDTQGSTNGQQPQRIGFGGGGGEAGQNLGSRRVRYVAAGTVAAPYIEPNAGLQDKIMAVAECSPNYVAWCEQQINELTTPPETVGNDFSTRLEAARNRRATETKHTDTDSGDGAEMT